VVEGSLSPMRLGLPAPASAGLHLPGAPAHPINAVPPPLSHPSIVVSSDPQLVATTHVEEPASVEALTPELQLAIACEVLHHLEIAEPSAPPLLTCEVVDL
jgi:hypothetical protein